MTNNKSHEDQPFEKRLERALSDDNMHQALERFAPSWRASRATVFNAEEADYGPEYSFAHMSATLRKAKDYAIEHQAELIAQFKAQAEAAGAVIYEARTAEDANRYIYELCQRKGIDLVVPRGAQRDMDGKKPGTKKAVGLHARGNSHFSRRAEARGAGRAGGKR
jgi:L-lactate utilization protein LutB